MQGAASSMLSKGVVIAVGAISIPITVRYLGSENFGIWVTISTALSMLLVLDLGVANSLTNFISEAYARDDRDHASTYTTTALGVVLGVALLLACIAWLIWPSLNWERLFHLSSSAEVLTVSRAVAAALAIFLLGLPAGPRAQNPWRLPGTARRKSFHRGWQPPEFDLDHPSGPAPCRPGSVGRRVLCGSRRRESACAGLDLFLP